MKKIQTPLTDEVIESLRAGDQVLLTGIVYTARDAAHKRFMEALDRGEELPIPIKGQVIYYVGPAPAKPGMPIGSAGPTTSGRMDPYAPRLIELGLKGMIGKGPRKEPVIEAMKKYKAVYFTAVGGAGAIIARSIKSSKVVAYEDLGPEAVRELYVEDLPLIVSIDAWGGDLHKEGPSKYRRE
ncbi:Fe-S-containing hydro-lyase [bacterium]|nr:MAG: Fe-S-containing hydro-lyase [bacterium]RKZ23120.1 MAG: Fe-S-containing hydro-lyase [bacterium]RKZ27576.1 MAG: Fe-S-containing hydro-lyase [bacterium]